MAEIPAEAFAAVTRVVQAYEPEATAAVIGSPSQLLSVMLEASRRSLEAAAPLILAAARPDPDSDAAGSMLVRTATELLAEATRHIKDVRAEERDRIRPLAARWRQSATHLAFTHPAWSSHFFDCAAELERLLDGDGNA